MRSLGDVSYGVYLAVPKRHEWRRLRLLPIKPERTLAVRAIRVSDCKIRSIPFDWPIRCNVRWKSLLPCQNRSLPIFVVPQAMLGERDIEIRCARWQMGFSLWEMSGDSIAWSQLYSQAYLRCLRLTYQSFRTQIIFAASIPADLRLTRWNFHIVTFDFTYSIVIFQLSSEYNKILLFQNFEKFYFCFKTRYV